MSSPQAAEPARSSQLAAHDAMAGVVPLPLVPTADTPRPVAGIKRKALRKPVAGHSVAGRYTPKFKFSRFFYAESWMQATRNATSAFLQHPYNEVLVKSRVPAKPMDVSKVIVIHPGSSCLRIGHATDAIPRAIPFVLARKIRPNGSTAAPTSTSQSLSTQSEQGDSAMAARERMEEYFKHKMRSNAFRLAPGAAQQVQSFNSQSAKSDIPLLNDPFHVEWLNINANDPVSPTYVVGQRAMEIPSVVITQEQGEYSSLAAWSNDIETVLRYAITQELGMSITELVDYGVVLVIPDIHERTVTEEFMRICYQSLKFRAILIGQESPMATMGAGLSAACVVDIGATKTSVSIVENGECIDSMTCLYGGDDVTRLLTLMLRESRFPAKEVDIVHKPWHCRLMNEIKEKWCTCNEAEIGVQLYDFYVRNPLQPTHKYQFKVYSEVYQASLCYLFPDIIPIEFKLKQLQRYANVLVIRSHVDENTAASSLGDGLSYNTNVTARLQYIDRLTNHNSKLPLHRSEELLEGENEKKVKATDTPDVTEQTSVPATLVQPKDLAEYCRGYVVKPLDTTIHHLISLTRTDERIKRLYSSVLLIGGASKTSGFGTRCLQERLYQNLPSNVQSVTVMPPPREVDPSTVSWKGGSILSRLDSTQEMWVFPEEFEAYGGASVSIKGSVNW